MPKYNTRERAIRAGYRSGLELDIADQIKKFNRSAEYEPFKIPYLIPESLHTYTPDYVLANGIVIESKGRFMLEDRKKHLFIREQHPELDIRFVFSRSGTRIRKNSKTTYADWCRKHDFEFADKLIPADWFKVKKNTQALTKIKEFEDKSDVKKRK